MRFALPAALILAASPVLAFDPGTHGEPTEEEGYFVGCNSGEEGGSACEVHARGAVFMAYSEGPSEPDAMNALAALPQGTAVKITGDMTKLMMMQAAAPNDVAKTIAQEIKDITE